MMWKWSLKKNGNIKIMIIVIAVLIAIIIGIVIFKISSKNKTVAVIEEEPYEYFALYSLDEKVGIVDKKANTEVSEPLYTSITQFANGKIASFEISPNIVIIEANE